MACKFWRVPFNATTAERDRIEAEKDYRLRESFRLGVEQNLMSYLGAKEPRDINEMLAWAIKFEGDTQVNAVRMGRSAGQDTAASNGVDPAVVTSMMDRSMWVPQRGDRCPQ